MMQSWISSAFSDFNTKIESNSTSQTRTKRKAPVNTSINPIKHVPRTTTTTTSNVASRNFLEKYAPKDRAELVVNKNKLDQLSTILDDITLSSKGRIVIIDGPSGSGKFTSLKVLCKEKNIDFQTWNYSALNLKSFDTLAPDWNNENDQPFESQLKLFRDFLFKSSRYVSDQIFCSTSQNKNSKKTLLLVRDIPNYFYLNKESTSKFQELMRQFCKFAKFSLIFILTTNNNSSNSAQSSDRSGSNYMKLFTTDLKRDLNLIEISFNAFANTYISKLIEHIGKLENLRFVDKAFIENVCSICNGDLRNALNLVELASNKGSNPEVITLDEIQTEKPKKRGQKQQVKRTHNNKVALVTESSSNRLEMNVKDASYSIFRALGKILHRKNLTEDDTNRDRFLIEQKLPNHLKKYQRLPMTCQPEDLYYKLPISPDYLNMYLHQNYLDILSSKNNNDKLSSMCDIVDNFILSDYINAKFEIDDYARQKEVSGLIVIRSSLFNLTSDDTDATKSKGSQVSKSAWCPLYKPFHTKINETKLKRKKIAKDLIMSNQDHTHMLRYLIDLNKEFFITFLPFIKTMKISQQHQGNFGVPSNKQRSKFHLNLNTISRQDYYFMFSTLKPVNTKISNQCSENDMPDLDDYDDTQNPLNQNTQNTNEVSANGNYTYENVLNIIDENF